jgi:hypothetical protein
VFRILSATLALIFELLSLSIICILNGLLCGEGEIAFLGCLPLGLCAITRK